MGNTFFPENDYRTYLTHGGPGSGRYPLGSGENPYQHTPGGKLRSGSKPTTKKVIGATPPAPRTTLGSNAAAADDQTADWFTPKYKGGKDKPLISAAERNMQTSDKIIQNSSEMVEAARVLTGNKKSAAADLSDEELADALKRLRMETEFDRLTEANTVDGFDMAVGILSMVGSLIGIAGGVVTIMSTVQDMKK